MNRGMAKSRNYIDGRHNLHGSTGLHVRLCPFSHMQKDAGAVCLQIQENHENCVGIS